MYENCNEGNISKSEKKPSLKIVNDDYAPLSEGNFILGLRNAKNFYSSEAGGSLADGDSCCPAAYVPAFGLPLKGFALSCRWVSSSCFFLG